MNLEDFTVEELLLLLKKNAIPKQSLLRLPWQSISDEITFDSDEDIALVEKYKDYLDWIVLSYNTKLPLRLIRENKDRVRWSSVWRNVNIDLDFLEEFEKKILWSVYSGNGAIEENIMEKYEEQIHWDTLVYSQVLPYRLIMKHIDKIDLSVLFEGLISFKYMKSLTSDEKENLKTMLRVKNEFQNK